MRLLPKLVFMNFPRGLLPKLPLRLLPKFKKVRYFNIKMDDNCLIRLNIVLWHVKLIEQVFWSKTSISIKVNQKK